MAAACAVVVAAAVILIAWTDRVEAADTTKKDYQGTSYIESREAIPVAPIEEEIRTEEESVLKAARMKEL